MTMENNNKYSRKEFLTTLGSVVAGVILLKLFSAKHVVKAITSRNGNQKNTYGNSVYGGAKKA